MATNRIDILDSALLRPGRIDRKIEFPAPGEDARLDILKIHSRKMNLTRGINLKKIAEMMPGASGAEVKGVCTEAGMYALRERRVHVTQEDFEMAVAKVTNNTAICQIKFLIIFYKLIFVFVACFCFLDYAKRFRAQYVNQKAVEIGDFFANNNLQTLYNHYIFLYKYFLYFISIFNNKKINIFRQLFDNFCLFNLNKIYFS